MFHLFIILFCSFILFLDVFSLRFNSQDAETTFTNGKTRDGKGVTSKGMMKQEKYDMVMCMPKHTKRPRKNCPTPE